MLIYLLNSKDVMYNGSVKCKGCDIPVLEKAPEGIECKQALVLNSRCKRYDDCFVMGKLQLPVREFRSSEHTIKGFVKVQPDNFLAVVEEKENSMLPFIFALCFTLLVIPSYVVKQPASDKHTEIVSDEDFTKHVKIDRKEHYVISKDEPAITFTNAEDNSVTLEYCLTVDGKEYCADCIQPGETATIAVYNQLLKGVYNATLTVNAYSVNTKQLVNTQVFNNVTLEIQ